MNIWNKVFLGVIFITAIAIFVLGAVNFHISNTGQKKIADLKKKIAESDDKFAKIVHGTAPDKHSLDKPVSALGIDELRGLLRGRYDERGRAWFGCMVAGMEGNEISPTNPQPGAQGLPLVTAQIIITSPFAPSETGAATDVVMPETLKGVVYVFEEKEGSEGAGPFLGRFHVDSEPTATKFPDSDGNEKNGWRIKLITLDSISEREINQIFAASKSRWAIYLIPPVDRVTGIFDQLTEEEKKMIPEELLKKFQPRPMPELTDEEKDGVNSQVIALWEKYRQNMDDPESELGQDFSVVLDWLYQQRSHLNRDIKIAESDIKAYETSEEKNKAENQKMDADCVLEEKRVKAMDIQGGAVKTLFTQYEAERNRIALFIEKLQTLIAAYAAEITNAQLLAVEKIEERAKHAE